MDFLSIIASNEFCPELEHTLKEYDWPHKIESAEDLTDNLSKIIDKYTERGFKIMKLEPDNLPKIIVFKKDIKYEFTTIKDFLTTILYYKQPKNLTHWPIPNPDNLVTNYKAGVYDYLLTHPTLKHLCQHPVFKNFFHKINNYGLYFRTATNKILRTAWFPPTAGIPLTQKPDNLKEDSFFLHDLGHLINPDLIVAFNSEYPTELLKRVYVNFRLLGEAITVTLCEMYGMDILQKAGCNPSDKPYALYRILCHSTLKELFRATFDYFCMLEKTKLMNLIDKAIHNRGTIWKEFDERFDPVAFRGREWTESNFEHLKLDSANHAKWWSVVCQYAKELELVTVEDTIQNLKLETSMSDTELNDRLFENVWTTVMEPIFNARPTPIISERSRQQKVIKRIVLNNIFPLVKHNIDVNVILNTIDCNTDPDYIYSKTKTRITSILDDLHRKKLITTDQLETYKELYIMIPTNLIKKEGKNYYQ
jgi:hypothetical protein